MADDLIGKPVLTDAAKASVVNSSLMTMLKTVAYDDAPTTQDVDMQALKRKALGMIENIEQLIGGIKLNDIALEKLNAVLTKLRSALQGGSISLEALAIAVSEAATVINTADGAGGSLTPQQKMQQLWDRIDKHNKDIDDDFNKMRKEGIVFEEKLWNKHMRLSEYLEAHPHDIEKQKELNAVDDQLLQQAEHQLGKHPDAQRHFDDAQKKSNERHKDIAEAGTLMHVLKEDRARLADADWGGPQGEEVSMDDITPPTVVKQKSQQVKTPPRS